ncbi:MAG: rhomboid family intramembrane serine protease [Woeseiaceae bacterium]
MFIPIKSDFPLPRFPSFTLLVSVICIIVFTFQLSAWQKYSKDHMRYCAGLDRSRLAEMVFNQVAALQGSGSCGEIMYSIANADDKDAAIADLVDGLKPFAGYNTQDSRDYMTQIMQGELHRYEAMVGQHPDEGLAHYSNSWNPWYMLTSTFAHGDWGHIIFNLVFWFAFAATVEALIGAPMFVVAFLSIALFTGIFNIVAAMATGVDFRTVGLSGIVTGMIGLYAFLLPHGRIRCYYFFVVIFGSIAIPAWALALWYIGGDVFRLFAFGNNGGINVMAHVTGGIGGYLFGAVMLRKQKAAASDLQLALYEA